MNNNSTSEPNHKEDGFDPSGFSYGVAFVIGVIFLLLTVAFACVRLRMSRAPNMLNFVSGFPPFHRGEDSAEAMEQGLVPHHHHINISFQSYPKLLYSQVERNHKDGSSIISSSCSICLGDYKESDMLRLLPDCGHFFHLACVDPWLRLHSTCPICRKSSVQASHSSSN